MRSSALAPRWLGAWAAIFLASSADAAAAGAGAAVPKPTLRQLEWTEMEIAAL